MKISSRVTQIMVMGLAVCVMAAPNMAYAQSRQESKHRQEQKNNWRNMGIAGAIIGGYGLLKGDKTLAALGIGGGLYSAWRYEQDRKSQSTMDRRRAQLFSRKTFTQNGHRYNRRTIWKNGKKYYKFVRQR